MVYAQLIPSLFTNKLCDFQSHTQRPVRFFGKRDHAGFSAGISLTENALENKILNLSKYRTSGGLHGLQEDVEPSVN